MSMPYEATVPVHRRLLWPAVIDPERLLAALPNSVIDAAGNQGVAGRLRVRMRDQTVTFRGIARVIKVIPASLRVMIEVEATFGRSGGAVEGVVEIALRAAGSGTRAVVGGSLHLTDDSSPLPPAEVVDAALGRIVRRWFATLADSSPAAARPDVPDVPDVPEMPPMPVPEAPRAPERAPLAVVRDVPSQDSAAVGAAAAADAEDVDMDIEETDAQQSGESVESGATDGESPDSGTRNSAAANTDAAHTDAVNNESTGIPADAATGSDSPSESESESGEATAPEPAAARSGATQVQLRLVSSREEVVPDGDDQPEYGYGATNGGAQWAQTARWDDEADEPDYPSEFDPGADSSMDTGEDIWSRLRDRGLPRWIPVVGSAVLAALGTTVLFVLTLRRHYRRHHR
jgi:carbon monoxide dehydrogenase subunit G